MALTYPLKYIILKVTKVDIFNKFHPLLFSKNFVVISPCIGALLDDFSGL